MRLLSLISRNRRKVLGLVLGILATIAAVYLVIIPSFTFSHFYDEVDILNFYAGNNDDVGVIRTNDKLEYYYRWAKDVVPIPGFSHVFEWLIRKFAFEDASLYNAVQYYLIGDYDRVIEELSDRSDHTAMHLLGISKFRVVQSEYLDQIKGKNDEEAKKLKEEFVKRVADESGPYFRSALEGDPDRSDYVWNYDLVMDPASALSALEGNKAPTLFILGIGPGDIPSSDGDPRLDEKSTPGRGNSKRKG